MFKIEKHNLADFDVQQFSLCPDTPVRMRGFGTHEVAFGNFFLRKQAVMIAKPRSIDIPEGQEPTIPSGDTIHTSIIEGDRFVAGFNIVTDGLSPASSYWWLKRLPIIKELLDEMANPPSEGYISHQQLPLQYPDLAHAKLQDAFFRSSIWVGILGELANIITHKLSIDEENRHFDADDPYPNLSRSLPKVVHHTILGYSDYRNDVLAQLPQYASIFEGNFDTDHVTINQVFDWYINAIFSHQVWVVPKVNRLSRPLCLGHTLTSNADLMEVMTEELTWIKQYTWRASHIMRLMDPNRHPEQMIAQLTKRYSPRSKLREQLLLKKPGSTFLTYRGLKLPDEWKIGYDTLSTAIENISRYARTSFRIGAITDGSLFPDRSQDREVKDSELAQRIASVSISPSSLLDTLEYCDDVSVLTDEIVIDA